ncbi:MAG: HK97 family phage prohead protease [Oscillospiraceae bacterium]|jgi:HK97 family phage prohead protease|nr:HK97 family phage prohead protease [Oscillospiraceae bacterium]
MAKETKRFQFKLDEDQPQAEAGVFAGYGAVFGNVDSGGDVIEPGAFTETLKDPSRVKILALHSDTWLPIGVPIELFEDERGLRIVAKISDTALGRDVRVLLRDGVLNELSIGYEPVVWEIDECGVRHLKQVTLWEVSVVTWAMNDQAVISDYKALADDTRRDMKEGRKISGKRITALKEASVAMKTAAKTIDALVKEAEGEGGKARQPPRQAVKHRTTSVLLQSPAQIEVYL